MKEAPCIGYNQYEEICDFKSKKEPFLWCDRCEKLRRKEIDRSFKDINKLFIED